MKQRVIACFGDSITGPGPGLDYREHYLKWPDHLGRMLEETCPGVSFAVHNFGKAGDSSSGLRMRLPEHLRESKPETAVVLIGGNNFGNNADPVKAAGLLKEDLLDITGRMLEQNIQILLLQYFEPRAENMGKVWTHLNAGNPAIAEVAEQLQLPILDLAPAFRRAADLHPLENLLNPVDGVHLNPEGEIVLAEAVCGKLQALGWSGVR